MHVFYCKKCKKDSLTPICEHCGQPITALSSNERFKWRAIRVPLGDARSIWGALKVLALAEILLILFCFIGELLVGAGVLRPGRGDHPALPGPAGTGRNALRAG